MRRTAVRSRSTVHIDVEIDEGADDGADPHAADHVRQQVGALTRYSPRPVRSARVRITRAPRPAGQPVVAHANLDISGRSVLAYAVGTTSREAIDLLHAKLRGQLSRMRAAWRRRATTRQSAISTPRRCFVLRSRSRISDGLTTAQAIVEMARLGYDFCLFTDTESQQDSALHRVAPDRYRLTQIEPRPELIAAMGADVELNRRAAPVMSDTEAIANLDATSARFVFYRDRTCGRGRLLYRRDDGNYRLIIPTA